MSSSSWLFLSGPGWLSVDTPDLTAPCGASPRAVHGGQVTATGPGSGESEFMVALSVSAQTCGDRSRESIDNLGFGLGVSLRRVMIVDDHEEMRKSVPRLVRAWGHEVALAADGPSALALADTFQPECAIVDISMSGMNEIGAGSSSPSAVSSRAAPLDRPQWLSRRRHPRGVPGRRFRCVSDQAWRYPRVGATPRRQPRGFRGLAALIRRVASPLD